VLIVVASVMGWAACTAGADGFGGPCSYVLPGAILPLPVHFNTTTGSPFTPQKAEFTDGESLPPSNFSATANWGDGQTTAAAISPEGCHQVTAPSHVYTHSGAYQFSYTVRDAHTGLDHEIGNETVYIWGVPQRVDATWSTRPSAFPGAASSENSPRNRSHSKRLPTMRASNGKQATAPGRPGW
jgi:hypothetical protein